MYLGDVFHSFFGQQAMVSNSPILIFHHYFSEIALNGTYLMFSPFSIWALADGSPHETAPCLPQLCSSDAGSIMW